MYNYTITTVLTLFSVLFFLAFFIKINSQRKIQFLNHILAFIFLAIWFFSAWNLFFWGLWNWINFLNIFHIWNLESFFLLIFSILWFATSFYSDFYFWEYLKKFEKEFKNEFQKDSLTIKRNLNFYYISILFFIFSMLWVIVANEAITFLIFWEIMSVSSYFLVIHDYNKKWILKEWAWYFIITHIWMLFILLSFTIFFISTKSLNFSAWAWASLTPIMASFAFFTALIWFWSKAGLFPVHIWLPKAHPIAPTNVSALMSWFMVKLPVFMILKFLIVFFAMKVQFSWFIVTILVASISAFIWIFYALIQKNIKKLLAYSTIENIWIIFLWVSILILWMFLKNDMLIWLWIFATLYHSLNHTIFKWLMFLLAWWIIERTWTPEYIKLWGLIKVFPFLWFTFLIWLIAIAWIIPLNWFNSEFLTFIWLFKSVILASWPVTKLIILFAIIALAGTAVLSLITFTKLFWITFLWNQRDKNLKYEKFSSISEKISYLFLILWIFVSTIFPWVVYFFGQKILDKNFSEPLKVFSFWNLDLNYSPVYFIWIFFIFFIISFLFYKILWKSEKKMQVWNCGYPYILPKTQYTSLSFIQPIRRIFWDIYREKKSFIKTSKYKKISDQNNYKIIDQNIIWKFYEKILFLIWFLAKKTKSLQNWEVHTYIGYMFIVIIILIWIVVFKS